MAFYFFYQLKPETVWKVALATDRQKVIREKKPVFVTALDVDNSFTEDLSLEETCNIRYSGDLYFDFDGAIDDVLPNVKEFLTKLKAKGVDLDSIRCYLTGGRGFHFEIPMATYVGTPPKNGVVGLPHIYKEMANELYVETLDLAIYSAGRGRQWRTTNVERIDKNGDPTGKFKVPVTHHDILGMNVADYDGMCTSPRNEPPRALPQLASEMALLFQLGKDKVEKALARKKSRKHVDNSLERFRGEWPEIVKCILQNAGVIEGVGWSSIALQLAITAVALGKTEEQLITDADPIINGHAGDSDKYRTPRDRRADLRRRYRFANGNVNYEFSPGGILALVEKHLRNNNEFNCGDYVPDPIIVSKSTAVATVNPDGTAVAVTDGVTTEAEHVPEPKWRTMEMGSLRVCEQGIFVRSQEHGWVNVCGIGMQNPMAFKTMTNDHIGFELDCYLGGKSLGRKHLPMSAFASRGQFHAWSGTMGASMSATDMATGKIVDLLRIESERNNNVMYALEREGVDLIVPPGCTDKSQFDVVWASTDRVISSGTTPYRFSGRHGAEGYANTDLLNAGPLEVTDAPFIEAMLNVNTTANMAKIIGWFSAAFMTQLIRRELNQFPLLQVYGQAGAGKSSVVEMCNGLHYHMKKRRQLNPTGKALTPFAIMVATATSASIPVVFEEVKPRELAKEVKDVINGVFRTNYRGDTQQRGSMNQNVSRKEVTIQDYANVAPVAFVGEAIQDQAAILERCVIVSLSKADTHGRAVPFNYCVANAATMGKLGKRMVEIVLTWNCVDIANKIRGYVAALEENLPTGERGKHHRPVFNLAVCMMGLELYKAALASVFGDRFEDDVQAMQDSILIGIESSIPHNMSEAARVLDVMAQLTRNRDPNYKLTYGTHYTVSEDGTSVDLKLRESFTQYVKWQRSLGQEVLFDTHNAFIAGMVNYAGTIKRACPENEALHDSAGARIFRLNAKYMEEEGVDEFEPAV